MNNQKGQTILEVLLAFSILAIIVTSITIASVVSLSNTDLSRDQNLAAEYSEGGMEMMRQVRDIDYQNFTKLSGHYCLPITCSSYGSCSQAQTALATACPTPTNGFIRDVNIIKPSASSNTCQNPLDSVKSTQLTVTTSWNNNTCNASNPYCKQTIIISCLSGIQIPAP